MKKNVAELIVSILDNGAETLVKDYALMLDKNKFNTAIIVLYRNTDTANDRLLTQKGVKIIPILKKRYSFLPLRLVQRLNYWWYVPYKLGKILKEEEIEILHVHMALLRYVKKISKQIKSKSMKLLYTCHSKPERYLSDKRKDENKAAKYLIGYHQLQIIALHDDMRKEINQIFGINSTVVIRNGIDFNRFRNISETREQIRKSLNIPENAFVIGHVGRFEKIKNHTFLVDVFSELCKRKENAFLLLVGAGELKRQIEEKLNSLGLQGKYLILSHRSDIPQLMKAMDVFVFPSLFEGLGIVLIEAQVSGLRCIVSDAVPEEAFKTELAVPVSLKKTPAEWCDVILDESVKGKVNGNIEDYDMNKEIKRLESLYLGEWHG